MNSGGRCPPLPSLNSLIPCNRRSQNSYRIPTPRKDLVDAFDGAVIGGPLFQEISIANEAVSSPKTAPPEVRKMTKSPHRCNGIGVSGFVPSPSRAPFSPVRSPNVLKQQLRAIKSPDSRIKSPNQPSSVGLSMRPATTPDAAINDKENRVMAEKPQLSESVQKKSLAPSTSSTSSPLPPAFRRWPTAVQLAEELNRSRAECARLTRRIEAMEATHRRAGWESSNSSGVKQKSQERPSLIDASTSVSPLSVATPPLFRTTEENECERTEVSTNDSDGACYDCVEASRAANALENRLFSLASLATSEAQSILEACLENGDDAENANTGNLSSMLANIQSLSFQLRQTRPDDLQETDADEECDDVFGVEKDLVPSTTKPLFTDLCSPGEEMPSVAEKRNTNNESVSFAHTEQHTLLLEQESHLKDRMLADLTGQLERVDGDNADLLYRLEQAEKRGLEAVRLSGVVSTQEKDFDTVIQQLVLAMDKLRAKDAECLLLTQELDTLRSQMENREDVAEYERVLDQKRQLTDELRQTTQRLQALLMDAANTALANSSLLSTMQERVTRSEERVRSAEELIGWLKYFVLKPHWLGRNTAGSESLVSGDGQPVERTLSFSESRGEALTAQLVEPLQLSVSNLEAEPSVDVINAISERLRVGSEGSNRLVVITAALFESSAMHLSNILCDLHENFLQNLRMPTRELPTDGIVICHRESNGVSGIPSLGLTEMDPISPARPLANQLERPPRLSTTTSAEVLEFGMATPNLPHPLESLSPRCHPILADTLPFSCSRPPLSLDSSSAFHPDQLQQMEGLAFYDDEMLPCSSASSESVLDNSVYQLLQEDIHSLQTFVHSLNHGPQEPHLATSSSVESTSQPILDQMAMLLDEMQCRNHLTQVGVVSHASLMRKFCLHTQSLLVQENSRLKVDLEQTQRVLQDQEEKATRLQELHRTQLRSFLSHQEVEAARKLMDEIEAVHATQAMAGANKDLSELRSMLSELKEETSNACTPLVTEKARSVTLASPPPLYNQQTEERVSKLVEELATARKEHELERIHWATVVDEKAEEINLLRAQAASYGSERRKQKLEWFQEKLEMQKKLHDLETRLLESNVASTRNPDVSIDTSLLTVGPVMNRPQPHCSDPATSSVAGIEWCSPHVDSKFRIRMAEIGVNTIATAITESCAQTSEFVWPCSESLPGVSSVNMKDVGVMTELSRVSVDCTADVPRLDPMNTSGAPIESSVEPRSLQHIVSAQEVELLRLRVQEAKLCEVEKQFDETQKALAFLQSQQLACTTPSLGNPHEVESRRSSGIACRRTSRGANDHRSCLQVVDDNDRVGELAAALQEAQNKLVQAEHDHLSTIAFLSGQLQTKEAQLIQMERQLHLLRGEDGAPDAEILAARASSTNREWLTLQCTPPVSSNASIVQRHDTTTASVLDQSSAHPPTSAPCAVATASPLPLISSQPGRQDAVMRPLDPLPVLWDAMVPVDDVQKRLSFTRTSSVPKRQPVVGNCGNSQPHPNLTVSIPLPSVPSLNQSHLSLRNIPSASSSQNETYQTCDKTVDSAGTRCHPGNNGVKLKVEIRASYSPSPVRRSSPVQRPLAERPAHSGVIY